MPRWSRDAPVRGSSHIAGIVQEAFGHATVAVTLDLYSHVVPSLQREAAKEMGAALFG
jgi:integrase